MSSFLCVISALHFCFCILILVGFSLTLNQCALAQIPSSSLAVLLLTCEQRWAPLVRLSCAVLKSPFVLDVNVLFAVEMTSSCLCFPSLHSVEGKILAPKGNGESFKTLSTSGKIFGSLLPSVLSLLFRLNFEITAGFRSGTSRCVVFTLLGWRPLVAVGPGCRQFWCERFPPQLGLNDLKWLLLYPRWGLPCSPAAIPHRAEKGSSVSLLCN